MLIRDLLAIMIRKLSQPEIVSGTVTAGPSDSTTGPAGDAFVVVCDAHGKEYLIRMTAEQAEEIEPGDAVIARGYYSAHKGYIDATRVKKNEQILGGDVYKIPRIF